LFDGTDLESKVGVTVLLVATDSDGWPRMASLSVGEVLAVSRSELLITLYRSSRTTLALEQSGRALLVLKDGDGLAKIQVLAQLLDVRSPGRKTFRAEVVEAEHDEVPYARVTHGIEFELVEGTRATERWRLQLEELRRLGES
jgi:hypothetical protein